MAEMQILQEQKFALGLTPHGVALAGAQNSSCYFVNRGFASLP